MFVKPKNMYVYVYHLGVMLVILESVKVGKIKKHSTTLWQSKGGNNGNLGMASTSKPPFFGSLFSCHLLFSLYGSTIR
jgi:hypothetical protein